MNKETVCVVMMICFESFNPYQSDDDDDDDDDDVTIGGHVFLFHKCCLLS